MKRFFKSQSGTTTVEFALLAPIFFIMVFGLVDLGRAYWVLSSMEYAVEGGGRYAMLNTSATSSQVIAQAQANLYAVNQSLVTFSTSTSSSGGINFMTVSARYSFNFLPTHLFNIGTLTFTRQVTVPLLP